MAQQMSALDQVIFQAVSYAARVRMDYLVEVHSIEPMQTAGHYRVRATFGCGTGTRYVRVETVGTPNNLRVTVVQGDFCDNSPIDFSGGVNPANGMSLEQEIVRIPDRARSAMQHFITQNMRKLQQQGADDTVTAIAQVVYQDDRLPWLTWNPDRRTYTVTLKPYQTGYIVVVLDENCQIVSIQGVLPTRGFMIYAAGTEFQWSSL